MIEFGVVGRLWVGSKQSIWSKTRVLRVKRSCKAFLQTKISLCWRRHF